MGTYVVDLWLDGYDTEEEMEDACEEFIYQQLNMTASAVTVDKYDYIGQLEAENKRLREALDVALSLLTQYKAFYIKQTNQPHFGLDATIKQVKQALKESEDGNN